MGLLHKLGQVKNSWCLIFWTFKKHKGLITNTHMQRYLWGGAEKFSYQEGILKKILKSSEIGSDFGKGFWTENFWTPSHKSKEIQGCL